MKTSPPQQAADQKRRAFLKLSGLLGLGAVSGALLPVGQAEAVLFGRHEYKVSKTRLAMGSFLSITAIHPSRDEAEESIGLAFAEVDRLSPILSRHDAGSPVSRLNATGHLAEAGPEFREVVARSLHYHRRTKGAFDITVKPLTDLYQASFAAGNQPSQAALEAVLGRVGAEHLRLEGGAIRFAREKMGITLDGIAPGYIVDRISGLLRGRGVVNHLINASGDIRTSGSGAKGAPWTVAIQDPDKKREYPSVIHMTNGAVSTSGDYEVYYDREKLFHHIVDGRTGRSPVGATSVTVQAATVMESDALSTGLFVMGPAAAVPFINGQPGCECFLVGRDGKASQSAGWHLLA